MAIHEKTTAKGGNIGFRMVRSKYVTGPDGYGKTINIARENLIAADPKHRDPGPNVVASHFSPGSHWKKSDDQKARWQTREWNSAEMGMMQGKGKAGLSVADKIKLKQLENQKPKAKVRSISEKINDRGTRKK